VLLVLVLLKVVLDTVMEMLVIFTMLDWYLLVQQQLKDNMQLQD